MVQVDVFWTYGLASGLTLAASHKLKNEKKNLGLTLIFLSFSCGLAFCLLLQEFICCGSFRVGKLCF